MAICTVNYRWQQIVVVDGIRNGIHWNCEQRFSSGQKPTIVKNSDDTLDVFWVDVGNLNHAYQSAPNGSWSNENLHESYGQGYLGAPVIHDVGSRLDAFWLNHDEWRTLHHARRDTLSNRRFSSTQVLGGPTWSPNRKPAVAQNADGRLEIFITGLDRQLYHKWEETTPNNSNQWSNWTSRGGPLLADPVVARNTDGRLEVFAVFGNNRALCHRWQTTRVKDNTGKDTDEWNWSNGWDSLGGYWSARKTPAVALNADDRLEVFMMGKEDQLYHTWQTTRDTRY